MEQQKVDLDALEAAMARATPGEWKWSISDKRVQVAAVRHAAQVCAVWNTSAHPATAVANAIVAAHNALPALIAELRELRAYRAEVEAISARRPNEAAQPSPVESGAGRRGAQREGRADGGGPGAPDGDISLPDDWPAGHLYAAGLD